MAYGQSCSYSLGARSSSIGGASVTLSDEYSLFNNVGALGAVEHHAVFAAYQNRYGIPEFQVIGGGALYSHQLGTFGIGYYKFGDDVFSEQKVHLAIGNQIQMISLGLAIDVLQYRMESIGTRQALVVEFGGLAEITPQLSFGAHLFNVTQAELGDDQNVPLPTVMKAGLAYCPSQELMMTIEVEKDLDFDEVIRSGLEYKVVEDIYLRTGVSTRPFVGAFGLGFHPKRLKVNYAFQNDSDLGNMHELAVAYRIGT